MAGITSWKEAYLKVKDAFVLVEDLNMLNITVTCNTKRTFYQDFLVILKRMVQIISKKCLVVTSSSL